VTYETKQSLFDRGHDLIMRFCDRNGLTLPSVVRVPKADWHVNACAYYRPVEIKICLERCAAIGVAGMAWSFPGHSVDRTPYGVLAHELGHHVDMQRSTRRDRYRGDFSVGMRAATGEEPLTSYCPDDGEWFAEMFRLFVTNPDLLGELRPRTYRALADQFKPVFLDTWRERLAGAPDRTITSIERKLAPKPKAAPKTKAAAPPAQPDLL
jgi:hypothetical protein